MSLSRDHLSRFLLNASGVRGVIVSLDEAWNQIQSREEYPHGLLELLGQTVAAAALFTGHIKIEGRLAIQLKGTTPVRTLFAECTHRHTVRGIAMWDGALPHKVTPRDLGNDALLAITIEKQAAQRGDPQRYQGLVALDRDTLSEAFEHYFRQSEQLPTRVLLAADGQRARGLMLQQLPETGTDAESWERAQALFGTLGGAELLNTDVDRLLHRLFHEEAPELVSSHPLQFGCSCSRERVGAMLISLGQDEVQAAIDPDQGVVGVQCEFCGQRYRFDAVDVEQLFAGGGAEPGISTIN